MNCVGAIKMFNLNFVYENQLTLNEILRQLLEEREIQ